MLRKYVSISLLIVTLAACQPDVPLNSDTPPTAIPFPTMTPGQLLHGILPPADALRLDGVPLANPATAVARANLPTPTPQYGICPPAAAPALPAKPANGPETILAITRYLSDGAGVPALDAALRGDWGLLDSAGTFRSDVDFTGEGTPDMLLAYRAPDGVGMLLVVGCAGGHDVPLYQSQSENDTPPQVILAGDMNFDGRADLLYTLYRCQSDNAEDCAYETQLVTWDSRSGRFTSLLERPINSAEPPAPTDMDSDRVLELVSRLTSTGTAATGPLRTGVNIYDWNGSAYVLSITQLDPPRFKIQVIHEADNAFRRLEMDSAISLYELADGDNNLRYWYNDEPALLHSYALFRLVVAFAYTEDDRLLPTYQAALQNSPDAATAPVYTLLTTAFWDAFQASYNLHNACVAVQSVIVARPEAVGLLNRYGSRSPTYTAGDLCPF